MTDLPVIIFILSCIYFTYIRVLTLYFTETLISRNLGYEMNPFLKEKTIRWINFPISLAGCYFFSFYAFSLKDIIGMGGFGILFTIFWIDFQHDWEIWQESNSKLKNR